MRTFDEFKSIARAALERFLEKELASCDAGEVTQAVRYVVLGGGHRWRPLVTIAAGEIFDREALQMCLPVGAAIELAHCASMILDDLPSMDDGQFRRGKPCVHRVFSRWAVDLAPVFMINLAYRLVLANESVSPKRRSHAALTLNAAGFSMIAGQELDLTQPADASLEKSMLNCHERKAGALYAAAAQAGALTCGADTAPASLLAQAGLQLGLSYQFYDDIADVTAELEVLGKCPGQDGGKLTAVKVYGLQNASSEAAARQQKALDILAAFGAEADRLRDLTQQASWTPA